MPDYRVAGFVSRLSAGKAIDRGALIQRIFAHLIDAPPLPHEAADVLTALALTPEEHARVTDDRIRLAGPLLAGSSRRTAARPSRARWRSCASWRPRRPKTPVSPGNT